MTAIGQLQHSCQCYLNLPEDELHDLRTGYQPLPVWSFADGTQEVVVVHDDVDKGISQQCNLLQGLGICQPKECHWHHCGMVEDMQE